MATSLERLAACSLPALRLVPCTARGGPFACPGPLSVSYRAARVPAVPQQQLLVRRADERAIATLARGLGLSDITARVLLARGLREPASARQFLAPRLAELRPPTGLAGFERGVERIARAVQAGEPIAVFGDYDVDGVTTAALLTAFLRSVGASVITQVAHREQGYGFSPEVASNLLGRGARLIVIGDCGTSDVPALELAASQQVDVVVIDHHTVPAHGAAHPSYALINPYREDSSFPFRGLASVGLAFYVAGAVRTRLRQLGHFAGRAEPDVRELLDLVALGTIADLVPLTDENRILVAHGLRALATRGRPGLAALLNAIGGEPAIDEQLVSWRLAPRLNAPGRLGAAAPALALLLAEADAAEACAAVIEEANTLRRAAQDRVYAEALELLGQGDPGPVIVLGKEGWPSGIAGIIAAKLVDKWQRPAFVVGIDAATGVGRGSARTARGVNLYQALAGAAHCLSRFGGHAAAAGFSIDTSSPSWDQALRSALTASVAAQRAALAQGSGPVAISAPTSELDEPTDACADAELPLARLTPALARELAQLAPFGQGNPAPRLLVRGALVVSARRVGDGSHLQITLGDGRGAERRAIFFRAGELELVAGQRVDCLFGPVLSEWNGRERVELHVAAIVTSGLEQVAPAPSCDDASAQW